MLKKIFCFGNPGLEEDSIALELADELDVDGFEFVKCTSPDFLLNLSDEELEEIVILDAVKGLKKVEVIEDIGRFKQTKTTTMHDFDLGTVLKLLKETGKINKVKIVGLPINRDKKETEKQVIGILKGKFL